MVDHKLSETDYIIQTPNHKENTCVCHINMLKKYVDHDTFAGSSSVVAPVASVSIALALYSPNDDRPQKL